MSISPRSRWSNRHEHSYQEGKAARDPRKNNHSRSWRMPSGDFSAPTLMIGQITSMVFLAMAHKLRQHSLGMTGENAQWSIDGYTLLVTVFFGIFSFLLLFRVSISSKAPKRRRRIARLWILGSVAIFLLFPRN
ncbi:MAG: hypothetical protein VX954_04090 [Candidatus Thermoplasmatota archaeon]|nr:hypothetical protein [Candidatus Thermoplasmatota archaeon]